MVVSPQTVSGAVTATERYVVLARRAVVLGVHRIAPVQGTVLATAQDGTSTGMLFGHLPTSAPDLAARLRAVIVISQHSTALATPTAPRLLLTRYTSADGLTGTLLAPALNDSLSNLAPSLRLSAASTGTTVVLGASFGVAGLAGALTAVGAYEPSPKNMIAPSDDEDSWPVFYPGEGFVIWQDVAGTTADTRKFNLALCWDEVATTA